MTLIFINSIRKKLVLTALFFISTQLLANPDYVRSWAWASNENAALNTPYTAYSNYSIAIGFERNSTYPYRTYYSGSTQITRLGTGYYKVFFENMTSTGGVSHVTAYGGNHRCNVASWGKVSNGQNVYVRCHSPSGELQNGRFNVMYYRDGRKGDYYADGYLWANNATSGSYTPSLMYQANASDVNNTITRSSVGTYTITMPGMNIESSDRIGGTVMVTAYGWSSHYCKSRYWYFSGADLNAVVDCYSANGEKADSQFTFSFMKEITNGISVAEDRWQGAYVWANQSTIPHTYYQSNYAQQLIERHDTDVGRYRIEVPGLKQSFGASHVKVTAYGGDNRYCNVINWGGSSTYENGARINVQCYAPDGSLSDSKFTLQYFLSEAILY